MTKKFFEAYVEPRCEVIEINFNQVIAQSATNTDAPDMGDGWSHSF